MSTILKAPITPYPLATKSQEVIPHEVTAPAGCYRVAIPAGASYVIADVPKVPIIAIATPGPVLAIFTEQATMPSVVEGEVIKGAMICASGITTIGNPNQPNLILKNEMSEAITVYVQLLHTWNILGTAQQTTRI